MFFLSSGDIISGEMRFLGCKLWVFLKQQRLNRSFIDLQ